MKKLLLATPFIVIALLWFFYPLWLPSIFPRADGNNLGAFGDTFGALNALFSGMAFAGIIISIILQSKELRETREELKGQKIQLERQAFESTFFQMLRLHNEIVSAMRYKTHINGPSAGGEYSGRVCLEYMKKDLDHFLVERKIGETAHSRRLAHLERSSVEDRYTTFYNQRAYLQLGHYFRNLYQIVKYVHNTDRIDRKFYTNIIRAQLSNDDLYLLFFNALSSLGRDKFKPLIEEYNFFEHLSQKGEINREDALRFGIGAFGENAEWKSFLSEMK